VNVACKNKKKENPSRGEKPEVRKKKKVGNKVLVRIVAVREFANFDRISEFPLIQGKGGIRVL
jgi:hypothetical protein